MNGFFPWQSDKFVVFAEGEFGEHSKISLALLKFMPQELIVGVLDNNHIGKKVSDVVITPSNAKFISTMEEAIALGAKSVVIGVSTRGGGILDSWVPFFKKAMEYNLNIVNGQHYFIKDDPRFKDDLANFQGHLIEYRDYSRVFPIGKAKLLELSKPVRVLSVGTDCNVGKMTALLMLETKLKEKIKTRLVATGQTAMMIKGNGVCIDALVADFVTGAIEQELLKYVHDDLLLVEGQGSIYHPSYANSSLSLLHGVMPHYLLFCHRPDRKFLSHTEFEIPALEDYFDLYQKMMSPFGKAPIIGMALNTKFMSQELAAETICALETKYQMPVDDPVRFGPEKLAQALLNIV